MAMASLYNRRVPFILYNWEVYVLLVCSIVFLLVVIEGEGEEGEEGEALIKQTKLRRLSLSRSGSLLLQSPGTNQFIQVSFG